MPEHQQASTRSGTILCWLTFAAVAYGGVLYFLAGPTGLAQVDGVLGVILGLYVCSHPAANFIDLLFVQRHPGTLDQSSASWVVLNLSVTFAGWLVIVMGMMRFVS